MLAIIARMEINPGDMDRFVAAAQPLIAPTLEEKGCHVYAMARDICEENVVWISEQWESDEDLATHLRTPHIQEFVAITGSMIRSLDARKYEVSSVGPVEVPS